MKTVVIYDEKEEKTITNNFMEIDLSDLTNYGTAFHIDECKNMPNSKVGNKTILEWFSVDNLSYWWFICPDIYRKFNEVSLFVDQLFLFLEENSPDKIELCGVYDKLDIIKQICDMRKIQLEVLTSSSTLSTSSRVQFTKNLVKKLFTKKLADRFKTRLNTYTKTFEPPMSDYVVLCSAGEYRRTTINEKGESNREEFILQPILDELRQNRIETLCFDIGYTPDTAILEERLKTNYNWIPIEVFLKDQKSTSTKKSFSTLNKSIDLLLKTNFENIFEYRDISLSKYMKPIIKEHLFETRLPTYLHLIKQLEIFFKKYPPKALIQVYEYGPIEKAIMVAAKNAKIPTFAIQHGVIHDHHPDYMHKELQDESNPFGNPIADLTLVFGNFYKKVLVSAGNYPEKKIAVIGNPTFYNIDSIKKHFVREKILNKYNLSDKKIILIPVDFNFIKSRNNPGRIILNLLEKKILDDKNLIALVRPHPVRPFTQSDLDGLYPSKIFKCSKAPLLEDIFISDMVITNGSTVAIDAILTNTPTIFANVMNNNHAEDIQKFMIEKNIAISCSGEELVSKIESFFAHNKKELEISPNNKDLVLEFFGEGSPTKLFNLIFS